MNQRFATCPYKVIQRSTKEKFSRAIQKGIGSEIDERSKGLITKNGRGFTRLDCINTALYNEGLLCGIGQRGSWKFVRVYDETSKIIFFLMSKKRFKNIQSSSENKFHYLSLLGVCNKNIESDQITFYDNSQDTVPFKKEIVDKALSDCKLTELYLQNAIEGVAVITFEFSDRQDPSTRLENIELNFVDTNFNIIHLESWNEYINVNVESYVEEVVEEDTDALVNTGALSIKKPNLRKRREPLVDFPYRENVEENK